MSQFTIMTQTLLKIKLVCEIMKLYQVSRQLNELTDLLQTYNHMNAQTCCSIILLLQQQNDSTT